MSEVCLPCKARGTSPEQHAPGRGALGGPVLAVLVRAVPMAALTSLSLFFRLQNTDAALLPCISYPAFALDDEALFGQTLDKVVRKLKGKYGFKRFLRDGYRTSLEDPNRRYYKPAEIKVPQIPHLRWHH